MTVGEIVSNFEKVAEFHSVFEQPIKRQPDLNVFAEDEKLVNLRYSLIEEETKEFIDAARGKDIVEMVDALADINYVVHGTGLAFGFNMDAIFQLAKIPKTREPGSPSAFFDRYSADHVDSLCSEFQQLLDHLKEAFKKRDIIAVAVVALRIIEKTYEVAADLNVDLDEAFRLVHRSNMTKACVSQAQAEETLEKYKKDLSVYKDPAIRQAKEGHYWIVYDRATGKTLKNKFYEAVNLRPIVYGA